MWSTPSLPLLPDSLWPGVAVSVRVPSIGQAELFYPLQRIIIITYCCGLVKGPEERHELGITWNKYIEQKYKYSIGKRVLNVSLTAKVLGWG